MSRAGQTDEPGLRVRHTRTSTLFAVVMTRSWTHDGCSSRLVVDVVMLERIDFDNEAV